MKKFEDILFYTITTRDGGVSKAPYDSLNLALHVGDNIKDVIENRIKLAQKYSFSIQNLIYMDQIHSDYVANITNPAINRISNCDAIVTNKRKIPLMVMVADCIGLLLFDPIKKVIATVHAGREGILKNIALKTVLNMQKNYNSNPNSLIAITTPSIGVCCYEIASGVNLDLKSTLKEQLLKSGLKDDNIKISPICTCCDERYFSYRREKITGRFALIAMLK